MQEQEEQKFTVEFHGCAELIGKDKEQEIDALKRELVHFFGGYVNIEIKAKAKTEEETPRSHIRNFTDVFADAERWR